MTRGLLAVALLAGCGGLAAEEDRAAGGEPRGDGGGATIDAGRLGAEEDEPLPASESGADPDPTTPDDRFDESSGCIFGEDVELDREPAFYECDAAVLDRCPNLRSCCVGDGSCCSAVADGPLPSGAVPLDACSDGDDAATCLSGAGVPVTAFGDPLPRIESGLLPNGDGSYDSGLLLGDPVDLGSHRIEVTATFGAPADCGASCLEGVAVGFTADEDLGASTNVRMLVGLLYSGSRAEVSLVVANEAVRRWPMEATEETWSLTVRPDGIVEAMGPPLESPASVELLPEHAARLVVYGHNTNRPADSVLGARLTSLSVTTSLCDIPYAWAERGAATLRSGGVVYTPSFLHGPSIATTPEGDALLAFELAGKIVLAERDDTTGDFHLLGSPDVSVVEADGAALSDPELVWADGAWRLYYTLDDGAGIGMAEGDADAASFTHEGVVVPPLGLARVEQPTLARHHTGVWIMVARTTDDDGIAHLAVLRSTDGRNWHRQMQGDLEALTARGASSLTGFDADDIAHPSLVIHDGAWQLYYAGRRGTRWSVGLIASDELFWWRSLGRVFSGDGNGFDRVGTSAPDATPLGDSIELVYEGLDGAQSRAGRAWRPATPLGTR